MLPSKITNAQTEFMLNPLLIQPSSTTTTAAVSSDATSSSTQQQETSEEPLSISVQCCGHYLTTEIVLEILCHLDTANLARLGILSHDWYRFITCCSSLSSAAASSLGVHDLVDPQQTLSEFYQSSPCSSLWDQLLHTQFHILYFPFEQFDKLKKLNLEYSNSFQLCMYLAKHVGKFKEITKLQYQILNPNESSEDGKSLFIRTHFKGNCKVGKSRMAQIISHGISATTSENQSYEPTSAFKLLTRSYQLHFDEHSYALIKGSLFDNSGTKTEFSRRSIFSPNVYAGKTSVLYIFNDEMESLESIPEWVKETAVNLTGGIRVKSNSVIGSRDNSVSDDNQKPPLELMVLNTFSLTSDSAQTPKSWKRPSLYTRVCHSQTFQHALNKAKELSLPFIYCSASTEDFESVKFVNLVSHVLLCKMYDIILEK